MTRSAQQTCANRLFSAGEAEVHGSLAEVLRLMNRMAGLTRRRLKPRTVDRQRCFA